MNIFRELLCNCRTVGKHTVFFTLEGKKLNFLNYWQMKVGAQLCYLENVFEHLNKVNTSVQGRNENKL